MFHGQAGDGDAQRNTGGTVLAILSGRPAYGYEITAWLRDQGFSDIAEGTVYALLVRIEQRGLIPSSPNGSNSSAKEAMRHGHRAE